MYSPSSKPEYFALSQKFGAPLRCPLLDRCERRAHTIALANDWPLSEAANRVGLKFPIVQSIGESAYTISGPSSFITGGLCPEVNLFESTVALVGLSGRPTTKAQYDKDMDPQIQILETGHFSACAEYISSTQATPAANAGNTSEDKEASDRTMGLKPPEKLTLKWLYEHAPWSFYVWLGGAISFVFTLGFATSDYRTSVRNSSDSPSISAQDAHIPASVASHPSTKPPSAK